MQLDYSGKWKRNGHVVILFANILDKWEIRAVVYGLPAKRPGARERVVEIMTKMLISLEPKAPKNQQRKSSNIPDFK